jgi:peptide/nickel transport system substrate-binding protein
MPTNTRTNRTFFLRLLAVAIAIAFTAAFAQEPKFGGTLRVASKAEPETLDQMWSTGDTIYWITANIFEGLYTYDANLSPRLMLAERHDVSEDGLVHTFHLRQGILFHNGKLMTSEDVVASVNRWMDRAGIGRTIRGRTASLEAVDQFTVRWTLTAPTSSLVHALATWSQGPVVFPSEVVAAAGSERMIEEYIGTGPFQFDEWRRGSSVHLSRFEGYTPREEEPDGTAGRRTAYVDEIVFSFVPETAVRLIGVVAGDLDVAIEADREGVEPYINDPSVQVFRAKSGTTMLVPNHQTGTLSDPLMRQAIAATLCVEDILQVYSSPEFYDVEPSVTGYGPWHTEVGADVYNQCDPARGRELAAQAGYDGSPIRVLFVTGDRTKMDMNLVIQAQLAEAGINWEIVTLDSAAYGSRRQDPTQYEAVFTESSRRPHPILHSHLTATGLSFWVNEEKEALINDLLEAVTQEEAFAVWERIEELWYEDLSTVKIGNFYDVNVASDDVMGLVPFEWPFFWNVWLDR